MTNWVGILPDAGLADAVVAVRIRRLAVASSTTAVASGNCPAIGSIDRQTGRGCPRLIRLDVHFAGDDSRRWTSLYVEPRIDTRVTYVFDVVSRRFHT